jgi:hypothetical protein
VFQNEVYQSPAPPLIIAGIDGYDTVAGNSVIGHRGITLSAGQEYFESDN